MKSNAFPVRILIVVSLITLALCSAAITKKDSLLLTYNLRAGQEYKLAYLMKNLIQTETVGYNISLDQNMDTYYTTTVEEDSLSRYTLATRIDRIKGTQKMMGSESTFDSESTDEPADPMGKEVKKAMDGLIGKVILMSIDRRGQVLQSNYVETLSQGSSGGMFMFDNSQTWYPVFSSKSVLPGSSWEERMTIGSQGFTFDCITTYTLESVNKKRAFLKVTSIYEPVEGAKLSSMKGTAAGTVQIDRKTGYPLESVTKQHIEMVLEEQGMRVSIKIDSDVTMKTLY
ncbi:MAG TPA: DUF6263 family protein [Bacteroidales bacterium]|nr:DUF6263 family protein [Bacteroidales bacterium]HNS46458.1 DUF6263 family protein [Bacteroidales bacterium]